jgi:hypothetical protein
MPSVYFPMVTPQRTELQVSNGQNIVVPIEGNMVDTSWPTLVEGTSIGVGSFNMDSISVTIKEAGRGLAMERLVKQYLVNGMYPGDAQRFVNKLAQNFVMSWENELRSIYLGGQFRMRVVGDGSLSGLERDIAGTGAAIGTNGTLTDGITRSVLAQFRQVRTGTFGTFNVQPYGDGLYRWVGNWNTIKDMVDTPTFVALQTRNQNMAGNGLIFQELGAWNGFMFVRHDLMPDGTSVVHGRNVAVQAFGGMFEDDDIPADSIMRMTDPVPWQIRTERNWKSDFHRAKAAAWYTVAGSSAALRDIGTHCIRVHSATS